MDKDEFLAAWEEACIEAAAKEIARLRVAWARVAETPDVTYSDRTKAKVAYRAIGPKLMEGLEFYGYAKSPNNDLDPLWSEDKTKPLFRAHPPEGAVDECPN